MARRLRVFIPGASVHVIQRGHNHGRMFTGRSDFERFIILLKLAARRNGLAVHGFSLMTTHVHLLATPATRLALSTTMNETCRSHVQQCNRKHSPTATLL